MKTILLLIALTCAGFICKAEEYKPFRVDLGLGYAKPSKGNGVVLSLEPKYAVMPSISIGLRVEAAGIVHNVFNYNSNTGQLTEGDDSKVRFTASYLLTGDYWFTQNKFRPFAGLGLGIYNVAGIDLEDESEDLNFGGKTNFGCMLRVGFDVSHFRLSIEYNFAGKDKLDDLSNYLGLKANVYFGGGRK